MSSVRVLSRKGDVFEFEVKSYVTNGVYTLTRIKAEVTKLDGSDYPCIRHRETDKPVVYMDAAETMRDAELDLDTFLLEATLPGEFERVEAVGA